MTWSCLPGKDLSSGVVNLISACPPAPPTSDLDHHCCTQSSFRLRAAKTLHELCTPCFSASLLFRVTLFCSHCGNMATFLASILRVLSPHSSHADFSLARTYEQMPDVAEHRHSFVGILPAHRYKLCPTVYLTIEDLFHILFDAFLKEKPFHVRHILI